ncbi:MAG: hypothetical protein INR71_08445 [Terriglobus roseus]|nr:hypothetical protein [Terriglobus roseus]
MIQRTSTAASLGPKARPQTESSPGLAPVPSNEPAPDAKEALQRQWTEASTASTKEKK